MTGKSDIAGYILAGGKGRRMGGKEKLYLQYEGKYLALRTMEALDMLENHYISVADIPKIRIRNAQWITDLYKDEGPLGGILSGLLQCPEKALFVVPCDMFGLERNLAERMIQAYIRKGKPAFFKRKRGNISVSGNLYKRNDTNNGKTADIGKLQDEKSV